MVILRSFLSQENQGKAVTPNYNLLKNLESLDVLLGNFVCDISSFRKRRWSKSKSPYFIGITQLCSSRELPSMGTVDY